jgi:hypothetical protein
MRKMIELEKYIRDQRDRLDSDSPRDGHEQRFLRKLERQPARKVNFRHMLQIAASIAIILASAIVLIRRDSSGSKIAGQELPASIWEADQYYTTQVSQRYDQIRQFEFTDSEEKAVLMDELNELDAYHQQLINDLEANPGDERVINSLIRHYKIKLEVMDQIIFQLNQFKTETEIKDEKESI